MARSKLPVALCRSAVCIVLALTALAPAPSGAQPRCAGDCDASGVVTIDEVILGVNIALQLRPVGDCPGLDTNESGAVEVDELITAVTSALNGCPQADVVQSDTQRETAPAVDGETLTALAAGDTAFAFDVYHAIRNEPGNLFYSPYSISLAFAMLYAGAANDTARQMAGTLHFTLPQEQLHPAMNALDIELSKRGRGRQGADGKGFRLRIANSIWGQRGYAYLPAYLDALAANYGAGLRLLDFAAMPEEARRIINGWVSDETEARIRDLLQPGTISDGTRLVLANAIYFNAAWANAFPPEATSNGLFSLVTGEPVTVSMMRQVGTFRYAQSDGYQAIELPYDGNELSMLILLPAPGQFGAFETQLDPTGVADTLSALRPTYIDLTMPPFTFSRSLKLGETLKGLGMRDAFDHDVADLSGIDGTRNLAVDFVVHQAFVKVNEAGTEAAAATAIGSGITSIPPPPIVVRIDRPFLLLIRDHATGAILFLGRVMNPAA